MKVKEHVDLILHEKNEKPEELLLACQSLQEEKKKVNELKVLQDVSLKEVEDVNLMSWKLNKNSTNALILL